MAINQNCRTSGPMFVSRPDNGMMFRAYKLRLQTDPVELVHQPLCAFHQLFLVLVVSRDARKTQERIILLEIIIAHVGKLIGFCRLPMLSSATRDAQNREPTTTPARFQLRGIREPWRERESKRSQGSPAQEQFSF